MPAQRDASSATAYWTVGPGIGELRREPLPELHDGDALVRTLHSGISRGTELLVFRGEVPDEIAGEMRAPFQAGEFPGPLKYGYLSVGVVEAGPPELVGTTTFCLYPHQDRYVVPAGALTPLPLGLPARRAVLAGAAETAVNAIWDAGPRLGDRVAVIGAGMIGCTVAAILRDFPLDRLQLVDVDGDRATTSAELGVEFRLPGDADGDCDIVIHASACAAGLRRGLELLGEEGELIELSWYGARQVDVPLGAAFHPRRLTIRASQVGAVSASRRARRSHADRMALAMDLLRDDRYDVLLTGSSRFETSLKRCDDSHPALRRSARSSTTKAASNKKGSEGAMFGVTVRDHVMVAHSLPREVFGPAQQLHGATYVVEATLRRKALTDDGIVVDIGLAIAALDEILSGLRYRNLDEHPSFEGMLTTTEVLAQWVADQLAAAPICADVDAIEIVLREHPDAWASYARDV